MNIFFDLDGTLLDSRPRLHQLFNFLVPESTLTFDAYWNYKRAGIGHEKMLENLFHYSIESIEKFKEAWLYNIEQPQWLALDKPYDGVLEKLEAWSIDNRLYIVTARQFVEPVHNQLNFLSIQHLFTNVFVTEQKTEKNTLVLGHLGDIIKGTGWFIGDTGKDIEAGKALQLKTAAVLTGFRSKDSLLKYTPDIFLESVNDFVI